MLIVYSLAVETIEKNDNNVMHYDVVIIGAGAAGLMCAMEAGKRGRHVLLVDHAKSVGEKIRISGGGRCNFTNLYASPAHYLSQNPRFCVSALQRYTQHDFIALVEAHDIAYHEKTLGQLFCDGSSKQIIQMLLSECEQAGVTMRLNTKAHTIEKKDNGFYLVLNQNEEIATQSLVIATGGPSIPKMGATGWGYDIAKQFSLNIIPPRAALVPFTLDATERDTMRELSGVALDAIVTCGNTSFREGMLFTHRGLSGPSILQISSYWHDGDAITVNLTPDLDVFTKLKALKNTAPKQDIQNALSVFLPKRLAQYLCQTYQYQGRIADLSHHELQKITDTIRTWNIVPQGTEGYRTAEVTLGGVDTKELSSKTFEATKVTGLYFIGEVVDVTGHLGGFNFQWAWSSGHAAGQFV